MHKYASRERNSQYHTNRKYIQVLERIHLQQITLLARFWRDPWSGLRTALFHYD